MTLPAIRAQLRFVKMTPASTGGPDFVEKATWNPLCGLKRNPLYIKGFKAPDNGEDLVITFRLTGPLGMIGIPKRKVSIGVETPTGTRCESIVTDSNGYVDFRIPARETYGSVYHYAFLAAQAEAPLSTVQVGNSEANPCPYVVRNWELGGY